MGLCVLDEIKENLQARKQVWHRYQQALPENLQLQAKHKTLVYNYAYFPVVFESEEQAVRVAATLKDNGVLARRYFYPSLDSVKFLGGKGEQLISRDIASRILCLPIYGSLKGTEQSEIIEVIRSGSMS
jgi:dTDP-4-amino-4,6-dideoxygalactose transaminase